MRKRRVTRGASKKEEAYFVRIQGLVMNAKTKGGVRVSYSRITFATLESHRDTPSSLVLSFFFLLVQTPWPSSFKHIFPGRRARYSFVYRAVCMLYIHVYNETRAFGQFPRVSTVLCSVLQRKISVTNGKILEK